MAVPALILYLTWLTIAFAVKSAAMKRATGSTGFHGISKDEGPIQRLARALIVVGAIGALASPILALIGLVEPFGLLDTAWIGWAGLVVALAGAGLSLLAQKEMGEAWRIGVEPGERTELVTSGLFARSRNPFFGAVFVLAAGLFLMVPNPVSVIAGLALVAGFEIQVRTVEEPNLREVFGFEYERYGRRAGRFFPGIGRFRQTD